MRYERRRRLLPDDATDAAKPAVGSAVERPRKDEQAKSYAEAAQQARERAVHTLFPLHWLSISLVTAGCSLAVGACLLLHLAADAIAPPLSESSVAWLRLGAAGSPGRWLASVLLVLAGLVALFVYSMRRHRLDDYHGRYRVWIWMALACLGFGLAETTGLPGLLRAACDLASEKAGLRGDVVWLATVATVAGAIGVRLFFEIRRSLAAVAALVAAVVGFLVAASTAHGWPLGWSGDVLPLLGRGSWLAGYVLVVLTFLLYARHVQFEVTGVRVSSAKRKTKKARKSRREKAAADTAEESRDETVRRAAKPALRLRTDLDPHEPAPSRPEPAAESNEADDAVAGSTHHPKKLSKAERRRLRREARMAS